MYRTKKKILIHLPVSLKPLHYGTQRRVVGVLKYFRARKDFFETHAVAGNKFGSPEWTAEQKQEALKFVDKLFIYEGENNLLDFFYTRSQSFYYQKLLKKQLPVDSDYCAPPGYVNFVQNLISKNRYNFIWINNLDYAHLVTSYRATPVHTLIDMHDICCSLRLVRKNIPEFKHLKFDYDSNLIREINLLNKFDTVIVDSHYEMETISSSIPPNKLHLVPHLVGDVNYTSHPVLYQDRAFKYELLFVGAENQPNKDGISFFLKSIFPEVVRVRPNIKLAIAGSVAPLVQVDASLEQNVERLGYVPDLSELYLKSRLVICPMVSGSGTKVKLLEAMAYDMPIVSTKTGAAGLSLSLKDGVNAFITDEPAVFAQRILSLIENSDLAQQFSENVAMTFQNQYSQSAIYSKLDEILGISASNECSQISA